MYLSFFGLKRPIFGTTPRPEHLFETPSHNEARASLIYGMMEHRGFVAVTGDVGLGKTTTLLSALRYMAEEQPDLILIEFSNPAIPPSAVMAVLTKRVGFADATADGDLDGLRRHMLQLRGTGRRVVLVFDEAQSIPPETLEFLRILSNLDGEGQPLLTVIFSGQTEFDEVMQRSENRALNQRIAIRARLLPLTSSEARAYVRHCISGGGGIPDQVMTSGAVRAIVHYAGHNPRRINILADNALIAGFGNGHRPISAADVKAASGVLGDAAPNSAFWRKRAVQPYLFAGIGAIAVIVLIILAAGPLGLFSTSEVRQMTASSPKATGPASGMRPTAMAQVAVPPVGVPAAQPTKQASLNGRSESGSPAIEAPNAGTSSGTQNENSGKPRSPIALPNGVAPQSTASQATVRTGAATAPVAAMNRPVQTIRYKVKSGDTLSTILAKYSLPSDAETLSLIRDLNPNFDSLNRIYAGQFVLLPAERATASDTNTDHLH